MLRKIIILTLVIGLPIVIYVALQHGQVQTVSFKKALAESSQKSDSEQSTKVKISAGVVIDEQHPYKPGEFFVVDPESTLFPVSYTGADPIGELKNGQSVQVYGHVHGGETPYFHASQVVK
ncbi:MAG: cytochrome c maturation protein CcmE [Candidatus Kapaibacterium sp.]